MTGRSQVRPTPRHPQLIDADVVHRSTSWSSDGRESATVSHICRRSASGGAPHGELAVGSVLRSSTSPPGAGKIIGQLLDQLAAKGVKVTRPISGARHGADAMTRVSERRSWRRSNVPLPEAHLGLGAVAMVMSILRPRRIAWRQSRHVGGPLIIIGVALAAWATRAAGTTDLARPDQLVTGGPYAVSRHPMYVAWTAIFLGVAFVMRAAWLLLLAPLLVVLTRREMLREEERLTETFGVEYEAYKSRVRRYL